MIDKNNIQEIIKALNKNGYSKITISYDGGNDDGSFQDLCFYKNDKIELVDWDKVLEITEDDESFDDEDFINLVHSDYERLNQWYSFAGDYSVHGTVSIDTATGDFVDDYEESTFTANEKTGNVFTDNKSTW
jgi:hypothetical protein